jgi:IclR family transcriptional regulator, pca regulon regulatory protein
MSPSHPAVGIDPEAEWHEPIPLLREPRYSQSLERGLAIMGCYTPECPLMGIAEIAELLGMSRSTTHRYVITLVALGYLEQGPSRKYRLGLRVTTLGMSALSSTSLAEHARPYIEELSRRSQYAVGVAILDGPEILLVDRVTSNRREQHPIDLELRAGSRLPVHCTAVGKLLMAHLPERDQRALLAELKLSRHGPNTITSKHTLRRELEQTLAQGLAVDDEELAVDLHAIAVPIRSESRETVAAVSMATHSSMISLEGLVEQLSPHLIATADSISARLGYRRDDERISG